MIFHEKTNWKKRTLVTRPEWGHKEVLLTSHHPQGGLTAQPEGALKATRSESVHHVVGQPEGDEVWSPTQFHSVDFSQSRIGLKSAFSTNPQSSFINQVHLFFNGVLGPLHLTRHTWRCPSISVVPEATHKASRGPLKGVMSAQKSLFRVWDGDKGVPEVLQRIVFPNEGSLICPPGK